MAAKYNWCVASTTKLIEMYEADEALYNVRHPEYKNRLRRLESYKNMAEIISRYIRPGCTAEDIKRKINGLRTSYSYEKAKMHKSKSGASAQAAYTPQVDWFQMLKFLDQSTEADESMCNLESTESKTGSERATPTFEEMFAHEMQEPVACSEAQPLRQERPPTKKRKVTPDVATNVMEEASRTLQAMADAARTMPVHEDRYSTLGAHIAAELREMERVGGREYTTATMHRFYMYVDTFQKSFGMRRRVAVWPLKAQSNPDLRVSCRKAGSSLLISRTYERICRQYSFSHSLQTCAISVRK
ncbi:uncharacterized protein LOC124613096 [Schistocerca americana]|uniref:uncharacterized protein LOC124613096 n=1 Tax=Schistocerca americana TaxID=7009 RepID=UPI001F4FD1B1|nr:uncharacterized protein LOC124613096 [Schistocerca americana]